MCTGTARSFGVIRLSPLSFAPRNGPGCKKAYQSALNVQSESKRETMNKNKTDNKKLHPTKSNKIHQTPLPIKNLSIYKTCMKKLWVAYKDSGVKSTIFLMPILHLFTTTRVSFSPEHVIKPRATRYAVCRSVSCPFPCSKHRQAAVQSQPMCHVTVQLH